MWIAEHWPASGTDLRNYA